MELREDRDNSGPSAPLLTADTTSPDIPDDDDAVPSTLNHSEGWFIWVLTFSAGISGLLFGYEYVSSITTPANGC